MASGVLGSYLDSPRFATGVEFSATDLAVLRQNVDILNQVSQRARDAWQEHREGIDSSRPELVRTNPLEHMAAGFRYRTGMTSLVVILENNLTIDFVEHYRVIGNGAAWAEVTLTAGLQTITISLAGRGLIDGQIVSVRNEIYAPGQPSPDINAGVAYGTYYVIDMYVTPATGALTTSWPGLPAFSLTVDTTGLNQLSNACDHLAEWLGLLAQPLFQAIVRDRGLFEVREGSGAPTQHVIWSGGIRKATYARLVIPNFGYQILNNISESFEVRINGTSVASIGPFGPGAAGGYTFLIPLTAYAADTPLRVQLVSVVSAALGADAGGRPSYYTLTRAYLDQGTLTSVSLPAPTAMLESMTIATLAGRLNALATSLATIKTRLDATSDRYDRIRLYRWGYGKNAGQRTYFQNMHIPLMLYRSGARLVVSGKNVVIAWGQTTTIAPEEVDGINSYKRSYEETLISSDSVATKEVFLDTLEGLGVGAAYVLTGSDVRFAAEYLR